MKHETRVLLKDLFGHFEVSYEDAGEAFEYMTCRLCNSIAKHNKELDLFEKLKHKPDCPVAIMRNRIRKAINEDPVED